MTVETEAVCEWSRHKGSEKSMSLSIFTSIITSWQLKIMRIKNFFYSFAKFTIQKLFLRTFHCIESAQTFSFSSFLSTNKISL